MAQNQQNPMDLGDLPEYLKSHKEGSTEGSPLVSMGQISASKKTLSWYQKTAIVFLMFMTFGIGGMFVQDSMSPDQMTVVVAVDNGVDPYQAIPRIVSESGGTVLSVTQNEDATYEVVVTTRKSRRSFLEWLRDDEDVSEAE